jgi:hypothetical protein
VYGSEGKYEYLRDVVCEELADLPDEDLEATLPEGLAEAFEDLSGGVHEIGAMAQRMLPGALTGAATGFAAGGAPGAVLGGLAGAAGSATGRAPSPPTTAAPVPGAAVAPAPTATAPVQNPAALDLIFALMRPEVVGALAAAALGRAGAATVPVAGTQVPVAAVTNLIQTLAARATTTHQAQAPRRGAAMPEYLEGAGPEVLSPERRAETLLDLLAEAAVQDDEPALLRVDTDADRRDLLDIYRLRGV